MTGKLSRQWINEEAYIWAKNLLNVVEAKVKVINPYNVQPKNDEATIVMCNHASHYDIPLSFYAFPQTNLRMLAKKELFRIPLMGSAMRCSEFPLIDRSNRQTAITNLNEVRTLLKSGIIMWIAPEGTRSRTGKLGPFKKGGFITAIQTGAKIIPVGIRGANNILPAKTLDFYLGAEIEIHVGQPIDASLYTMESRDELIARVHQEMEQLTGETNHDPATQ